LPMFCLGFDLIMVPNICQDIISLAYHTNLV
jgi:hypothetical protein